MMSWLPLEELEKPAEDESKFVVTNHPGTLFPGLVGGFGGLPVLIPPEQSDEDTLEDCEVQSS
jgi:hypothetical protein